MSKGEEQHLQRKKVAAVFFKVAFGFTGLIVGGYVGFFTVLLAGGAIMPNPTHLAEPGAGMAPMFAGLFIGIPVGALTGCILAVLYSGKVAGKISDLFKRRRNPP
jgi:hypothetical protein